MNSRCIPLVICLEEEYYQDSNFEIRPQMRLLGVSVVGANVFSDIRASRPDENKLDY
jgi:hypothetical protein